MAKPMIIPGSIVANLESIARSMFPMEVEARIPLRDINGKDVAIGINIKYEDIDVRAFIYSENFDSLTRCLKNNDVDEIMIAEMKIEHDEAKRLFGQYGECQRRRKLKECASKEIQASKCESCPAYGQPRLPNMYGWFMNSPSIAWHSHVTSKYGDINKLSVPSVPDSRIVATRIYHQGIPIIAEMITCTSEDGKQKTRLFAPPVNGVFENQGVKRKEMPLN